MHNLLNIIVATFAGILFFFGGALAVGAQEAPPPAPAPQEGFAELKNFNINCGFTGTATLGDCIPLAVYYLVYKPTGYLLTGSAYIFDALFPLSISSKFINQPFIEGTEGTIGAWTIVRDFANLFFIFILLYIGISTMFGMGDWRGAVFHVIVIALFINFSLFFTKVIIDTGNIFAVGIYNQMGTKSTTAHTNPGATGLEERGLAIALASHFQPQKFMNAAQGQTSNGFEAIFVFIVAGIVSVYVAFIFLKVAFMMVGRLIMFWYLMIASPVAFLSWATPNFSGYFGSWFKDLINQTFFPVVFLFFLYIIISVLNFGLLDTMFPETAQGMVDMVIITVLKAVIVVEALRHALKAAETMAGGVGSEASKWGMKTLGFAAGKTVGFVGKNVVGRGAHMLNKSGVLNSMATSEKTGVLGAATRVFGRTAGAASRAAAQGSFDFRGVKLVQKGLKTVGADMGDGPEKLKKGEIGGFAGTAKKREESQIKKDVERADNVKLTDTEKENIAKKEKLEAKALAELESLIKDIEKESEEIQSKKTSAEEAANKTPEKKAYDEAEKEYQKIKESPVASDADKNKAEVERDRTKKTYENSPHGIALKEATATLDALKKLEGEVAKEIIGEKKKMKDKVDEVVNTENERRAKLTAKRIEGGIRRAINIVNPLYSHKAAQKAAQKIRDAESTEGREKAKKKKEASEIIKNLAKEIQKETGGEAEKPKPDAGKKPDAPDHH